MKQFKIYTVVISMLLGITSCDYFVAGSYPFVERYEMPMSEDVTIQAIKNFKKNNPQYAVPDSFQLIDGRDTTRWDLWYHVYFYYPEEKQVLNTWTRPLTNKITTFAFAAICVDKEHWIWKDINRDFDSDEDDEQKKKFEERIVKKICPFILNPKD